MYRDIFGKTRLKLALHTHTTLSDGRLTPSELIARYKKNRFDAVAITDHWVFDEGGVRDGMTLISGCEYNVGGVNASEGVYHVVGLFCKKKPFIMRGATTQEFIDRIHDAGGVAIFAHPAWSLNSPEKIARLRNIDAIEIYNSVSGVGRSRRPDSSLIVDMLAADGHIYPLVATDDVHGGDVELGMSYIMLECESTAREDMLSAFKAGRFYATQGPEIHLRRIGDRFRVDCSPVNEIVFMSNMCSAQRVFEGNGITEAVYTPRDGESIIRAYVTDRDGRQAWTSFLNV